MGFPFYWLLLSGRICSESAVARAGVQRGHVPSPIIWSFAVSSLILTWEEPDKLAAGVLFSQGRLGFQRLRGFSFGNGWRGHCGVTGKH